MTHFAILLLGWGAIAGFALSVVIVADRMDRLREMKPDRLYEDGCINWTFWYPGRHDPPPLACPRSPP